MGVGRKSEKGEMVYLNMPSTFMHVSSIWRHNRSRKGGIRNPRLLSSDFITTSKDTPNISIIESVTICVPIFVNPVPLVVTSVRTLGCDKEKDEAFSWRVSVAFSLRGALTRPVKLFHDRVRVCRPSTGPFFLLIGCCSIFFCCFLIVAKRQLKEFRENN